MEGAKAETIQPSPYKTATTGFSRSAKRSRGWKSRQTAFQSQGVKSSSLRHLVGIVWEAVSALPDEEPAPPDKSLITNAKCGAPGRTRTSNPRFVVLGTRSQPLRRWPRLKADHQIWPRRHEQPVADDPRLQAAVGPELARLTHRAPPNLQRTLDKLEAFGLLEMRRVDRRRVPTVMVGSLHVEIDPYTMADRIEARPAHG